MTALIIPEGQVITCQECEEPMTHETTRTDTLRCYYVDDVGYLCELCYEDHTDNQAE